jgi:hypothetical protein
MHADPTVAAKDTGAFPLGDPAYLANLVLVIYVVLEVLAAQIPARGVIAVSPRDILAWDRSAVDPTSVLIRVNM